MIVAINAVNPARDLMQSDAARKSCSMRYQSGWLVVMVSLLYLKRWPVAGIGRVQLTSKESSMSDNLKNLRKDNGLGVGSPESQREAAVTAALTLILAKAGNSPDKTTTISSELENLSKYADQIQDALKVK